MIAYFIDNFFKQKSTVDTGSKTARITDDYVVQNVKGSSTIELEVAYKGNVDKIGKEGDFLFVPAANRREASFFQVISREVDYLKKTARFYGDTNLLWLASQNEGAGTYGRVSEFGQPITWYLEEFTADGVPFRFQIGVNEIGEKTAIGDTNATTAKEALDKTAELFGVEIAFSFTFDGRTLTPYIDIYEEFNGQDTGETLTVGEEITELVETADCSDVATAVKIRGAVSSSKTYETVSEMTADEELEVGSIVVYGSSGYKVFEMSSVSSSALMKDPNKVYKYNGAYYYGTRNGINQPRATGWECQNGFAARLENSFLTTNGQSVTVATNPEAYDDGDYYAKEGRVYSRAAWGRFGSPEGGRREDGKFGADIIIQAADLETTDPEQVLNAGIAILEQHKQPSISYSCKCVRRVDLGAYYTIVVSDEKVFISGRCLEIAKSETRSEYSPTFGNYYKYANAFEIMAKNAK